jgi:hypothetical protein
MKTILVLLMFGGLAVAKPVRTQVQKENARQLAVLHGAQWSLAMRKAFEKDSLIFGMTEEMVFDLRGEPETIRLRKTRIQDTLIFIAQWCYAKDENVFFLNKKLINPETLIYDKLRGK